MKKTTYIFAGAIGLLLIFCFVLPAILFQTNELPWEKEIVLKHTPGETGKETVLPEFHVLSEAGGSQTYYLSFMNPEGLSQQPSITIKESDSVAAPVLKLNPVWNNIVKVTSDQDKLNILFNVAKPKYASVWVKIPDGENEVGVLTVPRGMLREITYPDISLHLSDFKDADLTLHSVHGISAENSSFRNLFFKD